MEHRNLHKGLQPRQLSIFPYHARRNFPNSAMLRMSARCGSMSAVKPLLVFGIASILLSVSTARADPPSRSFVGNFIGNDATVENYLSVAGSVDKAQDSESLYLEKTISSKSSFSLFVGYQRLEQEGEQTSASGFSNLGLAYKRVLISLPLHEFVFTISPSLELPVGSRSVGSES